MLKLTCYCSSSSFRTMCCCLQRSTFFFSTVRTSEYRKTNCTRVNCDIYKPSRIEEGVILPSFSKNCEPVATRFIESFYVFFYFLFLFASLSMLILYDLYFDGIDNIGDEHVGDFDALSPGYSQYLPFSFKGGGLGRLGNNGPLSLD